jgi:PAS domain S-box-containing protein
LPEEALDDLTTLAATICKVPIALISLVDEQRQWFESKYGLAAAETPREVSFCAYALRDPGLFVVPDAMKDARFQGNPLVVGDPGIRFYAGAPLVSPEGETLGTLCVIDRVPRKLIPLQEQALRVLSRQVMTHLKLRRQWRELQASEGKLRAIFEAEPECVKLLGPDATFHEMNAAGLQLIEADTLETVTGQSLLPLVVPEDREAVCAMLEAVSRGEKKTVEYRIIGLKGTPRWVEMSGAPFREEATGLSLVLGVSHDITERKKLEHQALRTQRMESIGTLAGGIAHDLNNTLGPIIMSLDLLKLKFTDANSQELLAIISSSAQRGADMVRQVLSFARGVEGRRMDVQFKHLLAEMEKIAKDTFSKNIQIRTIIPHDLWTVSGDPTQLHQVLLNLCVNARDAMPNGGALTLAAENLTLDAHYAGLSWNLEAKPGPYVSIHVTDTGSGIPPTMVDKIFDPFFTTKELGKGTRLGLSTSLGIVKSHGGFIRVYSEMGKGTKFSVYLPGQTEASPAVAEQLAASMPRGAGELILVIDDEAAVRQITQQTLEAFGYRAVLASDGADAVAVYARLGATIAAVITDMMMPIMDGPATIQVLRRMNPLVRIIGASGLSVTDQVAQAINLGVSHFLPKPYTAETLLKVLKQALGAEGIPPAES